MEWTKKSQKIKAKVAIVCLALLIMSVSTVGVALGDMARAFPEVSTTSIQLVIGLPPLISLPFMLLSIPIARMISSKKLLIFIQLVYVVSGCSVFFIKDFTMVLIMRALMGVAYGLYNPIIVATISYIFEGSERGQVLGWRNAATMAGGIVFSIIGGYLALIGWQYVFLIYAVGLPCAIVAMFCLPDVKLPKPDKKVEQLPFSKKINSTVVLTTVKAFLLIIATHVSSANLSMHVLETGIGNSGHTGIAVALLMGAGVVAGIVLGRLFKKFRRFTVTIGIACQASGLLLTAIAPNLPAMFLGQVLLGYGLGTYDPGMQLLVSRAVNPAYLIAATGLFGFAQHLGQFVCPYLTTPLGDTTTRFLVASGLAVCVLVFDLLTSGKYKWYGTNYPADRPLPEEAKQQAENAS